MLKPRAAVAVALLVLGWLTAVSATVLARQETVRFIMDNDSANRILIGDTGDGAVIVVTGRSEGAVNVGDCAPGDRHVQPVVILDPGDERATRSGFFAVVSQETPLPPGTRIELVPLLESCAGGAYVVFEGIVR